MRVVNVSSFCFIFGLGYCVWLFFFFCARVGMLLWLPLLCLLRLLVLVLCMLVLLVVLLVVVVGVVVGFFVAVVVAGLFGFCRWLVALWCFVGVVAGF